ncbi:uncharacterized protein LOC131667052 [Phymastichus coffea]|uniref:uncharacterized protein LOC131667052 n=1 Tax=Phymastichus coffea TaxID=108790 RepID=UPI00273BF472|nr:uncharacterized protein LOC131667052 [Phymastichus coffea]
MSDSPKPKPEKRKLPPRPRIQLPVPGQYVPRSYPHTPSSYVSGSYGQSASMPMTPMTGQPTAVVYTDKTNEFFTHLKGIKNWTKSGLSVGEKSAFWLYEKVSSWSKRWFTHIFLFFVLFLYSILGAFLFMYVERTNERIVMEDIMSESFLNR